MPTVGRPTPTCLPSATPRVATAKPERLFIGHGSLLKRGDKDVRMSSLSKLNLIASEKDGTLRLDIAGQPRLNLGYRSNAPKVTVNGKTIKTNNERTA